MGILLRPQRMERRRNVTYVQHHLQERPICKHARDKSTNKYNHIQQPNTTTCHRPMAKNSNVVAQLQN